MKRQVHIMPNYSPLRYPGGKAKLSPFIKYVIEERINNNITTYIEPFAGGAGIALDLLINNIVDDIIINDYDKAIYSFWKAAIFETNRFISKIEEINITIDEWKNQKEIYSQNRNKYSFELGFATFFLNRTNRSGIIAAGPIGGLNQNGNYLIDVRFNKEDLINKIQVIGQQRKRIKLYNKDIRKFIQQIIVPNQAGSFIYFDPPYFDKGKELYKNYFISKDHIAIYNDITQSILCPWIITYDDVPYIADLYQNYLCKKYDLVYSLANKGKSSELIIFSEANLCPCKTELDNSHLKINIY